MLGRLISTRKCLRTFCGLLFLSIGAISISSGQVGVSGVSVGNGELMIYGTNGVYYARGFTSIGILFPAQYASTMCAGILSPSQQSFLAAAENTMTEDTDNQLNAMKNDWYANTVRFQVSQGALQYEHENGLSAYTDMAAGVINEARRLQLVVIVSMQTESRSCSPWRSDGQPQKLPGNMTEEAWAQLIPSLNNMDRGIILEIFNEPNTNIECSLASGTYSWADWENGCNGLNLGMKPVGKYVASLAPDNVLLFDGDNDANNFTGYTPPPGMPSNTAYTVHPYDYTDGPSGWDTRFGHLETAGYAVVTTEWNESLACPYSLDPNQTIATELVDTYSPDHHIGQILFSWDGGGNGELVDSTTFAPVDYNTGCSHFTGATLMLDLYTKQSGH